MQLSEPTYLWALLGLLVPIAIHLLSRKAGRVIQVGSIRHLVDSNTRKFSSLQFNEYLLFLLRALMILIFVLLLSGLSISGKRSVPKWVLLESEPQRLRFLQKSLDSLQQAGYELRYWAEGFPPVAEAEGLPQTRSNYAYLLSQLHQTGAEAIIYASNRLPRFRGEQYPLPEKVSWLQLPGPKQQTVLRASRLSGDTVSLLRGTTGPDRTSFVHSLRDIPEEQGTLDDAESLTIESLAPWRFLFVIDEKKERQLAILEAAVRTLADFTKRPLTIEKVAGLPDTLNNFDFVINSGVSINKDTGKVRIINFTDDAAAPLLRQSGPDVWTIRADLDRRMAVRENLLVALGDVFLKDPKLEQQIRDWDLRTIDEKTFFSSEETLARSSVSKKHPADGWLILSLILLFITERILAFYRQA